MRVHAFFEPTRKVGFLPDSVPLRHFKGIVEILHHHFRPDGHRVDLLVNLAVALTRFITVANITQTAIYHGLIHLKRLVARVDNHDKVRAAHGV